MSVWKQDYNGDDLYIISDVRAEVKLGVTDEKSKKRAMEIYDLAVDGEGPESSKLAFVSNLPTDSIPKIKELSIGIYNAAGVKATLGDFERRVEEEAAGLHIAYQRI